MPRSEVDTATLVAAVTDPMRRQMLDLLLDRGEATATALAERLPISRQGVTRSYAELREEAKKCALLCANCHAEVEAGLASIATSASPASTVEMAKVRPDTLRGGLEPP